MLIHDVVPYRDWVLRRLPDEALIHELWLRGVSLKDIFGRYYELETAEDGRLMTVEDAQLIIGEDSKPERKPF